MLTLSVPIINAMNRMKGLLLFMVWTVNVLVSLWSQTLGLIDWSLFGWAFAGATAFVVWEAIQKDPPQRKFWERTAMIAIGMLVSLSANKVVAEHVKFPLELVTVVLGAAGYKLFGLLQKKADKTTESGGDLTDLKKP